MDALGLIAVIVASWFLLRSQSRGQPATSMVQQPPPFMAEVSQPITSNVSGSDSLDNFLEAIFHYEGGRPGNVNYDNNNPGNLKSAPGQSGTNRGFAQFADMEDGQNALHNYVRNHVQAHPGWDFYDFFNYYLRGSTTAAPVDKQGNSDAYAEYVAQYGGFDPAQPIASQLGV